MSRRAVGFFAEPSKFTSLYTNKIVSASVCYYSVAVTPCPYKQAYKSMLFKFCLKTKLVVATIYSGAGAGSVHPWCFDWWSFLAEFSAGESHLILCCGHLDKTIHFSAALMEYNKNRLWQRSEGDKKQASMNGWLQSQSQAERKKN